MDSSAIAEEYGTSTQMASFRLRTTGVTRQASAARQRYG
jgi:hypothetical protein